MMGKIGKNNNVSSEFGAFTACKHGGFIVSKIVLYLPFSIKIKLHSFNFLYQLNRSMIFP